MSLFEEEEILIGDAACSARKPACPKNDRMIWKLSIKAEFLTSRREKSTLSQKSTLTPTNCQASPCLNLGRYWSSHAGRRSEAHGYGFNIPFESLKNRFP